MESLTKWAVIEMASGIGSAGLVGRISTPFGIESADLLAIIEMASEIGSAGR